MAKTKKGKTRQSFKAQKGEILMIPSLTHSAKITSSFISFNYQSLKRELTN